MWKVLFDSVQGIAHRAAGTPCQDCCTGIELRIRDEPVLILACSDGAGSARLAHVGSQLAAELLPLLVARDLAHGKSLRTLDRWDARSWCHTILTRVQEEAQRRRTVSAELACTLLAAALGPSEAVFFQIGDGAIVAGRDGRLEPVFWPQSGEYANTTFFVTSRSALDRLDFAIRQEAVDQVALFTDGLQRLALRYADRTVHGPFFAPMFEELCAADEPQRLREPLRQFLDSPQVNQRTEDDKTLMLAARVDC